MMFVIIHALFFIMYRFYSNCVENKAPRSNFAPKSAYKKLTKKKKEKKKRRISDLHTLIFFGMVVETQVLLRSNLKIEFARNTDDHKL